MSTCKSDVEVKEVCFTPANGTDAPVTLLLHTKRGELANGTQTSVSILTTADDQNTPLDPAAYLSGGTYVAGVCQLPQPLIEQEELCERLADGSSKKFLREVVIRFDALGAKTRTVTDYELDGTTAYTVIAEAAVGDCGCSPLENSGLVTDIANFK